MKAWLPSETRSKYQEIRQGKLLIMMQVCSSVLHIYVVLQEESELLDMCSELFALNPGHLLL